MPSPFGLDTIAQRHVRGSETTVTLTQTTAQVIGHNSRRTSITFGIAGNNTGFVSTNPSAANLSGFPLTTSSGIYTFTLKDQGAVIQKAWFGSVAVANAVLTILESEVVEEDLP